MTVLPFRFSNRFVVVCLDSHGRVKWREIANNLVTTEGQNHDLSIVFKSGVQVGTWYGGLINNSPSPTLAVGDTAAQIGGTNGWTEFAGYSGSRKALTLGTPSAGLLATSSASQFSINSAATLFGLFVVSAASGTSGTLFGEAAFASTQAVVSGDTVRLSATLSLA